MSVGEHLCFAWSRVVNVASDLLSWPLSLQTNLLHSLKWNRKHWEMKMNGRWSVDRQKGRSRLISNWNTDFSTPCIRFFVKKSFKMSNFVGGFCCDPFMPTLRRQADLWVWCQPDLYIEFQDSQGYEKRPCLKTKQENPQNDAMGHERISIRSYFSLLQL